MRQTECAVIQSVLPSAVTGTAGYLDWQGEPMAPCTNAGLSGAGDSKATRALTERKTYCWCIQHIHGIDHHFAVAHIPCTDIAANCTENPSRCLVHC